MDDEPGSSLKRRRRDKEAWKGVRSAAEQAAAEAGGAGPADTRGIPAAFSRLVPAAEWLAEVEKSMPDKWRPRSDLDLEE